MINRRAATALLLAGVWLWSPAPHAASAASGKEAEQVFREQVLQDDPTWLERVGDWFATTGKTDAQKRRILLERAMWRSMQQVRKDAHQVGDPVQ